MTRADRVFQFIGYSSMLAIASMAAYVGIFEKPPLSYPVQPFPVISRKVYPGEPVFMVVRRISTENDETSYVAARWLVNVESGDRAVLPAKPFSVPPGDHTGPPSANFVIPADFLNDHEPGFYYAAWNVSVDGAVRSFKVAARSEPFEIIRPGSN